MSLSILHSDTRKLNRYGFVLLFFWYFFLRYSYYNSFIIIIEYKFIYHSVPIEDKHRASNRYNYICMTFTQRW